MVRRRMSSIARSLYRELNRYRENKSNITEKNMINARSNFKNLIRKKRYMYDKSKTEKLISTKYDNAKAYWRLLKQAANKNIKIILAQSNLRTISEP